MLQVRHATYIILMYILHGCSSAKHEYYSYRVSTYAIDSIKHYFYSYDLISYGDYVFEFKKRVKVNKLVYNDIESTSTKYDTIGVYLLSGDNSSYWEFDTFASVNKIVKAGPLSQKEFGFKFDNFHGDIDSTLSFQKPRDTLMNNIHCYYSWITDDGATADTLLQNVVMIKGVNFNSPFKVGGIKFTNPNYCIVGFQVHNLSQKQSFLQELELLRPLNNDEEALCANMVKSAESHSNSERKSR